MDANRADCNGAWMPRLRSFFLLSRVCALIIAGAAMSPSHLIAHRISAVLAVTYITHRATPVTAWPWRDWRGGGGVVALAGTGRALMFLPPCPVVVFPGGDTGVGPCRCWR